MRPDYVSYDVTFAVSFTSPQQLAAFDKALEDLLAKANAFDIEIECIPIDSKEIK
ncbi:MAG TPA: hypothetical protein VGJ60_07360 [Chloroflexota bacterium]|jgi:hypothetical protein